MRVFADHRKLCNAASIIFKAALHLKDHPLRIHRNLLHGNAGLRGRLALHVPAAVVAAAPAAPAAAAIGDEDVDTFATVDDFQRGDRVRVWLGGSWKSGRVQYVATSLRTLQVRFGRIVHHGIVPRYVERVYAADDDE